MPNSKVRTIMTEKELKEICLCGETTRVQFKSEFTIQKSESTIQKDESTIQKSESTTQKELTTTQKAVLDYFKKSPMAKTMTRLRISCIEA